MAERSDGAFDITVGPCVNLWRRARRQHELPDPERLAQARRAVGYRLVRLSPKEHAVELLAPGMRLDLGGIAKGYAVDQALLTLEGWGVNRALIEGGGDMRVGQAPPGKPGWRIELAPLDVTNPPPARFLLLENAAISTSSDLYQRLEIGGKRYSHIVDPRTGIGLTNHCLVNVIARQGITADSLTKVVSVLGPERGLKVIAATPGAAARLMQDPGGKLESYESSRFKRYYSGSPSK
jgi:thiamine biosynthesis lipoprotein